MDLESIKKERFMRSKPFGEMTKDELLEIIIFLRDYTQKLEKGTQKLKDEQKNKQ